MAEHDEREGGSAAAEQDVMMSLLDLNRRLPPQAVLQNIEILTEIYPDYADDLLSAIDTPLAVKSDGASGGREYLVCDYNREEGSHRSPWSNVFEPALEEPSNIPPAPLRALEVALNEAFGTYRELYYDAGLSSVYLWDPTGDFPHSKDDPDLGKAPFAGIVLLKKQGDSGQVRGSWDAIHVFEVEMTASGRSASYKLTSTILLSLLRNDSKDSKAIIQALPDGSLPKETTAGLGTLDLSGTLTRQSVSTGSINLSEGLASHVINIGRLIEDSENKMRGTLQEVYFSKTKDIVNTLRSQESLNEQRKLRALQQDLMSRMGQRGKRG